MAKMTVEDTSLTAVADAIRAKGGTNDALVFPEGFVSAVDNIDTRSGYAKFVALIDRTITDVTSDMLEGCTRIGYHSFYNCLNLKTVDLPGSVTVIDGAAFQACKSLTSITFSDGLKNIELYAFYSCDKLASITIPRTVTYIGQSAFASTGLRTVRVMPTSPPTLGNSVFPEVASISIIVPKGTLDTYRSATNWSAYADKMAEATE